MPDQKDRSPHDNRRRAGRVRCNLTQCQFGPIVNLSRTGMRVVSRKPIALLPAGASVNVKITAAGATICVPARPVHARPRPDGMFDVGFQFVGLSEKDSNELMDLARTAWDPTMVYQNRRSA